MSHYSADLRDLEFTPFEFLDTKDRFGTGPFAQMHVEGELAAVRFFTTQVLPRLSAERVVVQNTDNALMAVDEAAL